MKRLRWTWSLLRLVAQSRGWHIKELPGQLPRSRFPKRKGLASSTLHAKAKKGARAPRKIAEYLMTEEGLPTREKHKTTAKVVRLGLAALSGLPSPTVAGKLDALSGKLDTTHAKIDIHGGKLDALRAELAEFRAEHKSGRHVTGTVLGIVLLLSLFAGRQLLPNTISAETPASMAQALLRAAVGAWLDLGKKTEEHWIPKEPAPWQKLAKDCDKDLGETAINGGCWTKIADMAPPCGKLFRHGNGCYRPIAADPLKPVGLAPGAPGLP